MTFNLDASLYSRIKTPIDYFNEQNKANQESQANDQKIKEGEIKRLVSVVTPDNYSQVRQEGIEKGLWSDAEVPHDYKSAEPIIGQLRQHFGTTAGSFTPSAIQEYNFYKNLPADEQANYMEVKRNPYLNAGNQYVNPYNPTDTVPINVKPDNEPALKGAQKAAETTAVADATSQASDDRALPIISQLREYNKDSFDMPYSDTMVARGLERMIPLEGTQAKRDNTDLLKQARLDLAAPLAKQLGVNPTDKDFQASLDRIFDTNASKGSREKQINALEQRIMLRQKAKPNLSSPIPSKQAQERTIVKTQISPSTGKRKIIYSDGTEEIQ